MMPYNGQTYQIDKYGPPTIKNQQKLYGLPIDQKRMQTVSLVQHQLESEESLFGFGLLKPYSVDFYDPVFE